MYDWYWISGDTVVMDTSLENALKKVKKRDKFVMSK